MADFDSRKAGVLASLASGSPDKSPKGGLDAPIAELVAWLNAHGDVCTTSSCSGRTSLLTTEPGCAKGGTWAYVSHDPPDLLACEAALLASLAASPADVTFRYEPFILTAETRTLADALALVAAARSAGFRESGVAAAARRPVVTLRCSLRLEAPLVVGGVRVASPEYLAVLVRSAREKHAANAARTAAFHRLLLAAPLRPAGETAEAPRRRTKRGCCAACGPLRLGGGTVHAPADDHLSARQELLLARLAAAEARARDPQPPPTQAAGTQPVRRALRVPLARAVACKAALKERGWLDGGWRA